MAELFFSTFLTILGNFRNFQIFDPTPAHLKMYFYAFQVISEKLDFWPPPPPPTTTTTNSSMHQNVFLCDWIQLFAVWRLTKHHQQHASKCVSMWLCDWITKSYWLQQFAVYLSSLWKCDIKNLNISITNDPRGKLIIYSESVDNNACRKNKFDMVLPLLPPFWPTSTEITKMEIFPQPLNIETKKWYILDVHTKAKI